MKTITNKETGILASDTLLDRTQLLKLVVDSPEKGGIVLSEMKIRIKILDAITNSKDNTIVLEDAEFTLLKSLYERFGWLKPHKDLIELGDHLDEVAKQK